MEKIDPLQGRMLTKLPIITKTASNKSCSELNFLQKSQAVHMSVSPMSGARRLQRLPYFKYYNVLEL